MNRAPSMGGAAVPSRAALHLAPDESPFDGIPEVRANKRGPRAPRVPDSHYEAQITEEQIERYALAKFKRPLSDLKRPDAARTQVVCEIVRAMRAEDPQGLTGPNFTTQYAVDWAKRMGWTINARESFDARTNRTHDLKLGMDVECSTPDGVVMIQADHKDGTRAAHHRRFVERGGVEQARRERVRCLFLVFERGNPEPIHLEEWA